MYTYYLLISDTIYQQYIRGLPVYTSDMVKKESKPFCSLFLDWTAYPGADPEGGRGDQSKSTPPLGLII